MKKLPLIVAGLIAIFAITSSCSKNENEVTPSTARVASSAALLDSNGNCLPLSTELFAGKHHLAGDVTISNDAVNLYVTINTSGGWQLGLTHLYAGPLSDLPATPKGNPKIGNFPYQTKHTPFVTTYTYTIPLSNFEGETCIVIATHAEAHLVDENGVVTKKETAWGAGTQMSQGGSWASYTPYCICIDNNNNGNGSGN